MTIAIRYLSFITFALGVFALAPLSVGYAGEADAKRVAIHVNENDPKKMNLALNNAANIYKYYNAKGEKVMVRIVTYGRACICCGRTHRL